jgi:hypothetical protein
MMAPPKWESVRGHRWPFWTACALGGLNAAVGFVAEGLGMVAVVVVVDRSLTWLNSTERELTVRLARILEEVEATGAPDTRDT